ncbi:endo alpha-1,4 polygalactosaminidase [Nocardia panacis]|uniref:endo alpha-1,4 polygalactosaminidase n=1 Tax=Nocardia panacis TaxID=2340916 RepID=UPI001315574E|nr:endo alpha-1,4 polygalactosaminidase [Nocardia panacis]
MKFPRLAALLVCVALLGACASNESGGPEGAPTDVPHGGTDPMIPRWQPRPGLRWQYQLQPSADSEDGFVAGIDLTRRTLCRNPPDSIGEICATAIGFDLWTDSQRPNAQAVAAVHRLPAPAEADGHAHAICYFSGGSLEDWRPDAPDFLRWSREHPEANLLGGPVSSYPNERWLNIKPGRGRLEFLADIMEKRMRLCRQAGFDAVDPDWADGWLHNDENRLPTLTAADQLAYNRMLAALAHRNGLAIALKNDTVQAAELAADYDLAIIESCQWNGADIQPCAPLVGDATTPGFVQLNKPVLHVEYLNSDEDPPAHNPNGTPAAVCAAARADPAAAHFSTIVKQSSSTLRNLPYTIC